MDIIRNILDAGISKVPELLYTRTNNLGMSETVNPTGVPLEAGQSVRFRIVREQSTTATITMRIRDGGTSGSNILATKTLAAGTSGDLVYKADSAQTVFFALQSNQINTALIYAIGERF